MKLAVGVISGGIAERLIKGRGDDGECVQLARVVDPDDPPEGAEQCRRDRDRRRARADQAVHAKTRTP